MAQNNFSIRKLHFFHGGGGAIFGSGHPLPPPPLTVGRRPPCGGGGAWEGGCRRGRGGGVGRGLGGSGRVGGGGGDLGGTFPKGQALVNHRLPLPLSTHTRIEYWDRAGGARNII